MALGSFPLTEGGHRVFSAAGAVETPLLCIVSVSAHLCYFQTRKGHRDPRETHFPPSLELLFLPHTCFCCHLSLAKRRNKHWGLAGLKALACRMGKRHSWSSARGQGSAPCPLPGSPAAILVLIPCREHCSYMSGDGQQHPWVLGCESCGRSTESGRE